MSRRTLEQGVVSLVEKHGLEAVEASLRMWKMTMAPRVVKPPKQTRAREIKVPLPTYAQPMTPEEVQ